jgi:cytochrome c oxidase assembly protein Cox11
VLALQGEHKAVRNSRRSDDTTVANALLALVVVAIGIAIAAVVSTWATPTTRPVPLS